MFLNKLAIPEWFDCKHRFATLTLVVPPRFGGGRFNNPMESVKMKKLVSVIAMGVLLGLSGATMAAGDAAAGKAKAATCAGCHGANGISNNPMWPNLKGQKEGYLIKQLKAFRDGTRTDPMMSPMAKPLTDAEIDNLAAYFSSL